MTYWSVREVNNKGLINGKTLLVEPAAIDKCWTGLMAVHFSPVSWLNRGDRWKYHYDLNADTSPTAASSTVLPACSVMNVFYVGSDEGESSPWKWSNRMISISSTQTGFIVWHKWEWQMHVAENLLESFGAWMNEYLHAVSNKGVWSDKEIERLLLEHQ